MSRVLAPLAVLLLLCLASNAFALDLKADNFTPASISRENGSIVIRTNVSVTCDCADGKGDFRGMESADGLNHSIKISNSTRIGLHNFYLVCYNRSVSGLYLGVIHNINVTS